MSTLRNAFATSIVLSSLLSIAPTTAEELTLAGHWKTEIGLTVDIAQRDDGVYYGAFSQPDQGLNGLLLIEATLDKRSVSIVARKDEPLLGTLSEDGQTIEGEINVMNTTVPITLTRSGDAEITSNNIPAIDERFTGTWSASFPGGVVNLRLENHGDGITIAELVNVTEGGLRIPASKLSIEGTEVAMDLQAIGAAFQGNLNAEGNQIAGEFRQGNSPYPLAFSRLP